MALFENAQWEVTDWGMGTRKPETKYDIPAERFLEDTERDGQKLYDWPIHMAQKPWVDIELFIEAFKMALEIHKDKYAGAVDHDILAASCHWARLETRRR